MARDPYNDAIDQAYPTPVIDYYKNSTPYQVGSDVRSSGQQIVKDVSGAIARGNANAGAYDANMQQQFDKGPLMSAIRGAQSFYRGVTGAPEAPTTPAREQSAGTAVAARPQAAPNRVPITTPQDMDRMRANAPNPVEAPAIRPATRAISAPERVSQNIVANTDMSPANSQPDARTAQLIDTYNRDKVKQGREADRDAYFSALDQYTPTSGDTWFNFMQKGLQRRALTQAYRDELSRRQLDDQIALQNSRQNFEDQQGTKKFGQETALENQRIQGADTNAANAFERDRPFKESESNYRGALSDSAKAQAGLVNENLHQAQQRSALIDEYQRQDTSPERRKVIATILNKKSEGETPFDKAVATNLGMNLGTPTGSQVMALYGQAEAEASDPQSPYYGNTAAAYAALEAALGTEKKAEGGVIGGQGAEFGGQPDQHDLMMALGLYRKYAVNTQALGGTPIPPERFVNLLEGVRDQQAIKPPQDPNAMGMPGYAEGGAIDVSGKQVIGPGDGKSDSIPAVVDGSRPAAISTGEFVMPVEAVKYFGTAKLDAMIEKAKQAVGGN